ncbi:hypothetical protein VDG1235_4049 [Verrucomicrobiia bacterium DG1235]|nr:hypothetical protein VDG1235_4049 [Verrucomicrobiae bacterium DG1235]
MSTFKYPSLILFVLFVSRSLADDLTPLSDEFEDASSLASWSRIYESEGWGADQMLSVDIGQSREGYLTMVPRTSTWYRDYRGILMYKLVQGDFVATIDVEARNRAVNGPPGSSYSLAGIMVRTPRDGITQPSDWSAGGENYLFLSLGTGNAPGNYQFEVKSTLNSASSLEIDAGAPRALIQIARVGDVFLVLRQLDGGEWEVHRRYERPDMQDTLQVGITVYTDWESVSQMDPLVHNQSSIAGGSPDLHAEIDYFRLRRPRIPSWIEGSDFTDPVEVSDSRLVQLFGDRASYDPSAPAEYGLKIIDRDYFPGEGLQVAIEAVPGYFYRVESSVDLENWAAVGSAEADAESLLFTIPDELDPAGLYIRVVEE